MEVTRKDAEEYIAKLKQKFHAKPEKYREFCRVLLKFVQGQLDYSTLMLTVVPLIEGHRELILGLKKFLPENCRTISCKKEVAHSEAAVDLTLNLAGGLEETVSSSHEEVDLTLTLAGYLQRRRKSPSEQVTANQDDLAHSPSGNLQSRRNSARKQVQLTANRGGTDGDRSSDSSREQVDLSLSIGCVKVQDATRPECRLAGS